MKRLIFITQQVDPGHPALAATVPKIRALAELVDEVIVLADRVIPGTLPPNCRGLSFASRTKAGRGAKFQAALTKELARRPRPFAIVAHMCPIYAVLAAPLARPLGVPLLLWFTHWRRTRTLEAAERVSTAIVSVDRRSFPIDSGKVVAIGHGIDLDEFPCREDGQRAADFRISSLGRYSRAKGLETVVRGVAAAAGQGLDVRLEVHGPALSAAERSHRAELHRLVAELGIEKRVRLDPAVLRSEVPDVFDRADCLVNNMEAGAPDKIVYEAGASCLPVVASNPVFDELLDGLSAPLQFARDDPEELAKRIERLAMMTPAQRASIGRVLHERVAAGHSVEHWARRILAVAGA
jgi:glycosyltransferase involved in cell wall biosynthesis